MAIHFDPLADLFGVGRSSKFQFLLVRWNGIKKIVKGIDNADAPSRKVRLLSDPALSKLDFIHLSY